MRKWIITKKVCWKLKEWKKLLLDSDGKDVRNKSMFADDSYFEYKKIIGL